MLKKKNFKCFVKQTIRIGVFYLLLQKKISIREEMHEEIDREGWIFDWGKKKKILMLIIITNK